MKSQTEVQGSAVVRTTSSAPSTQASRVRALSSCLGSRRVSGRIPGASGSLDCWATGPAGMKSYVEGSWRVWKAPWLARLHCARSCRGAVESREAYFWTWDQGEHSSRAHVPRSSALGYAHRERKANAWRDVFGEPRRGRQPISESNGAAPRGSTYIQCPVYSTCTWTLWPRPRSTMHEMNERAWRGREVRVLLVLGPHPVPLVSALARTHGGGGTANQ